MSTICDSDSERTVICRIPSQSGQADALTLANNIHRVFIEQLSEDLGCAANAVDVRRAVRVLKTRVQNALRHCAII